MVIYLGVTIMVADVSQVGQRPKRKFKEYFLSADNQNEKLAIGLMSGTSLDGIDAAIIKSDGTYAKRWGSPCHVNYSDEQRAQLKQALMNARKIGKPTKDDLFINQTEELLTDLHAEAVFRLLEHNNLSGADIDLIGFHGQTLLHGPDEGWTWQIGDGAKLAKKLDIPVVNDLRRHDVEHGGQGAPLVPVYHHAIIQENTDDFPVALVNIGGVANITWIGSSRAGDMVAFDTGPGNAMLDDFIRKYSDYSFDRDGIISTKGSVHRDLVERWMENRYFSETPPKSLDRDDFDVSDADGLSLEDGAATLCAFTVAAIRAGADKCPAPVNKWYVCGGGAHNPTIMSMLGETLDGEVAPVDLLGINGDFIEAEAFAYMAVRRIFNLPITFPGTTGISTPSTGGIIHNP